MQIVANILIAIVALEHVGILVLEMFFWDHPLGYRIFGTTPEVAASSTVLAMNQGLYNGFMAVGLIWGIISDRRHVKIFFLACVVLAGIFAGVTAKPSIVISQAFPAFVALVAVILSTRQIQRSRR